MTNWDYYSGQYLLGRKAVIDFTAFPYWERKAANEVRNRTFGNIDETKAIPNEVQGCVCELAEYLFECKKREDDTPNNIQSEKDGTWSVSYASHEATVNNDAIAINKIICEWLSCKGYMYRGVR